MRAEYMTADDVADAAQDLMRALQRAGAPDVEIDRHTVTTYSERGPYPAYAVDCTIRGGAVPAVRIVRLHADGTEEPPTILPHNDVDALVRVILSALTPSTPKEPTE